jgi:hypothetical protein
LQFYKREILNRNNRSSETEPELALACITLGNGFNNNPSITVRELDMLK